MEVRYKTAYLAFVSFEHCLNSWAPVIGPNPVIGIRIDYSPLYIVRLQFTMYEETF